MIATTIASVIIGGSIVGRCAHDCDQPAPDGHAIDEARFLALVAVTAHCAIRVMQTVSRRLRSMDRRYRRGPLTAREPFEP